MTNDPLDVRVPVMMSRSLVGAVDQWRRSQPDLPSRSESIRRLIQIALQGTAMGETDDTHPNVRQNPLKWDERN